ncbi:TetR/AcrR family transcriptional regulator [Vibrio coralliilyticus]|uniref:TetR/AcrR family transcriptional regulator n=1 Tax=Vibrio coralliilyticus TaxID=190893 RepID=UPI002FD08979
MPAPRHSFAEQERLVLDAAAQSILESSLIDFKMSNIAKNAGLSMGSVYKHIQSKEDVLVALSVRLDKQATAAVKEVLSLPYSLPTKIVAINLLSEKAMYLYPFGYQLMTMLSSQDLLAKASEKWLNKLSIAAEEIRLCFEQALRQAIQSQELLCNEDEQESLIEEFLLLNWAISIGFPQIVNHPHDVSITESKRNVNIPLSLEHPLIRATIRMTNSYPWKHPVSIEELSEIEQILQSRGMRENSKPSA